VADIERAEATLPINEIVARAESSTVVEDYAFPLQVQ
jgi:hypothetical protein